MENNTVIPVFKIPGRLRIKVEVIYKDREMAMEIKKNIIRNKDVFFVKYNIFTSSFLILYDYTKKNTDIMIKEITEIIYTINQELRNKYDSEIINNLGFIEMNRKDNTNLILKILLGAGSALSYILGFKFLSVSLIILAILDAVLKKIMEIYLQKTVNCDIDINLYKKKIYLDTEFEYFDLYKDINTELDKDIRHKKLLIIGLSLVLSIILCFTGKNIMSIFALILLSYLTLTASQSKTLFYSFFNRQIKDNILVKGSGNLEKLADVKEVVFVTGKKEILNQSLIERLREIGILDIKAVIYNNDPLRQWTEDLGVKHLNISSVMRRLRVESDNEKSKGYTMVIFDSVTNKYYHYINHKSVICVMVLKQLSNSDSFNEYLAIEESSIQRLPYIIDFSKYTMEKIYQNHLVSLWIFTIGVILSFRKFTSLTTHFVLNLISRIVILYNSFKVLQYN